MLHRSYVISATIPLVVGLVLASAPVAYATTYAFVTIDVPGATSTLAASINNSGEIVGQYGDANGFHGFLFSKGTFTTIDVPGVTATVAESIDDSHRIVGASATGTATVHPEGIFFPGPPCNGFLFSKGTFTAIDVPGAICTLANGINNPGHIVGLYDPTPFHGFLFSKGTFTTIDVPGSSFTFGRRINNSGQIVGTYGDTTGQHGFIYSDGIFTTIDVPGASNTAVWGINDPGQIVGLYQNTTGFHGFLAIPDHTASPPLPELSGPRPGVSPTPDPVVFVPF